MQIVDKNLYYFNIGGSWKLYLGRSHNYNAENGDDLEMGKKLKYLSVVT